MTDKTHPELDAKIELLEGLVCTVTAEMLELKAEVRTLQANIAGEAAKKHQDSMRQQEFSTKMQQSNNTFLGSGLAQQNSSLQQSAANQLASFTQGVFGMKVR